VALVALLDFTLAPCGLAEERRGRGRKTGADTRSSAGGMEISDASMRAIGTGGAAAAGFMTSILGG
jgi:hypothetical protein